MLSISQYQEKYHMGHYDLYQLMCALLDSCHFDSIEEVCEFLEDQMFDEFELNIEQLIDYYNHEKCFE